MKKENATFSNRYLAALILPLIVEVFLNVSVGMADTMMVSQAGEAAVSGVAVINNIQNLLVFLLYAFGTGGAVVASQLIGKGDAKKASHAAKQLMNVALLFSSFIALFFIVFKRPAVTLIFGTLESDVFDSAMVYFVPILLSIPPLAIQSAGNALLRSMGRSRTTMAVSIIVNIVNVAGNALLVLSFGMGAAGVGIATLASRAIGALIIFIILLDKKALIHISEPFKPEFDLKMISLILRIALPSGIETCIFHIGKLLVASTIALLGTSAIAADAVLNNIGTFCNIPGTAIGMAAVTIIGQCAGAGKHGEVKYYAGKLLILSIISMTALSLVLTALLPTLVGIYNLPADSTALAISVTRLCLIQGAVFWSLSFVVPNFLRATGDVKFTMYVSIISMWAFRVILSRFFAITLGMGLAGIYWGMYTDWYCRIICFAIRFLSGRWKTKSVV